MKITKEIAETLKHAVRNGIEIKGFIPLYQSSFIIRPNKLVNGEIERLDVIFNADHPSPCYRYIYMLVKNVVKDEIIYKDSHLTNLFNYLIGKSETNPIIDESGIELIYPEELSLSVINSLNNKTMPKLSEKASIIETGEIKKKCYSLSERIKYSKDNAEKRRKARQEGSYTQSDFEKRLIGNQQSVLKQVTHLKKTSSKDNIVTHNSKKEKKDYWTITHNKRLSRISPFKEIKTKTEKSGFVCIKDSKDNSIIRISRLQAKTIVESEPNRYAYTTKLEWRIQRDSHREKQSHPSYRRAKRAGLLNEDLFSRKDGLRLANPQIKETIQRVPVKVKHDARFIEVKDFTEKSKTKLMEIPAHTTVEYKSIRKPVTADPNKYNLKIKKEKNAKGLKLIKFSFTDNLNPFRHYEFTKWCEDSHPTKSAGSIAKKIADKKKMQWTISIIEDKLTKEIKPKVNKNTRPKVEEITKFISRKKLVIDKNEDGSLHKYYVNETNPSIKSGDKIIPLDKITTHKVIRKGMLPKTSTKVHFCKYTKISKNGKAKTGQISSNRKK